MAPIQFGILMVEYQMLDVAGPLDILSSSSKPLIQAMEAAGIPGSAGLTEKAIDIEFHHINESMDPVTMTAGFKVFPTTTIADCPPLDYLLVGGPDPATFNLSEGFSSFVQAHIASGGGLFTTCTGAFAIAASGVLDGKNATTNHKAIPWAKMKFPKVLWTDELHWVVDGDGQFWTAGGACAGMDMMAHWLLEKYGKELTHAALEVLDFEPRDVNGNRMIPELRSAVS